MKQISGIKPPKEGFWVEKIGENCCNIYLYEDVREICDEMGERIYQYDCYSLRNRRYRPEMEDRIRKNTGAWLKYAKEELAMAPSYSEMQKLAQELTDLELMLLEQKQQIDCILQETGGKSNV